MSRRNPRFWESTDFQSILDRLPGMLLIFDREGALQFANRPARDQLREPACGTPIGDLISGMNGEKFQEIYSEIQQSPEPVTLDPELPTPSPSTHYRFSAAPEGSVMVTATASPSGSNRPGLREAMQASGEAIVILDSCGEIVELNATASRIFGYRSVEAEGSGIELLLDGVSWEEMKRKRAENPDLSVYRLYGKSRSGERIPVQVRVSPDPQRYASGYVVSMSNLSEQMHLKREILQISEEERRRIGSDLHDGLGQMLTGIGLIARNLVRKLEAQGAPGAGAVQEIVEMVQEADQQARALAHGLVHMDLERDGLTAAIDHLCIRSSRLFSITCHFELDDEIEITNKVAALHIYRMIQEAISNAVKHGRASEVWVLITVDEEYLNLKVIDNGKGFSDPEAAKQFKDAGPDMVSYRAHLLGGFLNMRETEEGFTELDCKIPVKMLKNV